jgi:hypothetical protein
MKKSVKESKAISFLRDSSQNYLFKSSHKHNRLSCHDIQSLLNNSARQFFVKRFSQNNSRKNFRYSKDINCLNLKDQTISQSCHESNKLKTNSRRSVHNSKKIHKRIRNLSYMSDNHYKHNGYMEGI